jgi:hypothetical protein
MMTLDIPLGCAPGQTVGGCQIRNCDVIASTSVAPQAGPIHISDGQRFDVFLDANGAGAYGPFEMPGDPLPGGELITVSAPGADVPAFSGAVTEPSPLVLDSPLTAEAMLPWNGNQDLTLMFEGGAPGVELTVAGFSSTTQYLVCEFPSEAGTVTIPASLLSQLPADTFLLFFTGGGVRLSVGDYKVDLLPYVPVITASTRTPFQVHLQ